MKWSMSKQQKLEDLRYQVSLLEREKEASERQRMEQVFMLFGGGEITTEEVVQRRQELHQLLQTWEREDGS